MNRGFTPTPEQVRGKHSRSRVFSQRDALKALQAIALYGLLPIRHL
jgi:hypothetical protein